MNVLIIAEDDRNDRFILEPLINAMFRRLKRPRTEVDTHPIRNGGWEFVKQWEMIRGIIESNRPTNLFLLCIDRDNHQQRREILDRLEEQANQLLEPAGRLFLAEHAWQEIEVWLAGIDWRLKPKWTWEAIRSERDSKEHYFEPIVKARGFLDSPGRGRAILGAEAAGNYAKVRQNCPEVRELEDRIRQWIAATPRK